MCGIQYDAFGLVEKRHLGVDDQLFEVSDVLRGGVVVHAVDEGQAKVCTQPAENSIYPARSRHGAAAKGATRHGQANLVRRFFVHMPVMDSDKGRARSGGRKLHSS